MSEQHPTPSPLGNAVEPRRLRLVLRAIARWALTSTMLGVAPACGAYHDPGAPSAGVLDAGTAVFPGTVPSNGFGGTMRGSAGGASMVMQPMMRPAISPPIGSAGSGMIGSAGRASSGTGGFPGVMGTGGSAVQDAGMNALPWRDIYCAGDPLGPLANVEFARPVDYVGIYVSSPGSNPDADAGAGFPASSMLLGASGGACINANNSGACWSTLELLQAPSTACTNLGNCASFLLTTFGDEVSRSEEPSSLIALLGTIDSPEKAAVIAMFYDYKISCRQGPSAPGTQGRPSGSGYDLRTEFDRCGSGRFRETLHVTTEGTLDDLGTELIAASSC